ncbi:MAG: cbb3-type cytochrome c oxidase subunit 3 [Pseudomonadota bacterium]
MEIGSFLREIADNWMLVAMFTLFLGCILWAFRPGSRQDHEESANVPFRHDDKPAEDPVSDAYGKEAQP